MTSETTNNSATRKYLSFCLGDEEYGVPILRVREIIGIIDITPLPRTPDYIAGVINLRGRIIPVVELRRRFGLPPQTFTEETCIIVIEMPGVADTTIDIGVIVDAVSEVIDVSDEMIDPTPRLGNGVTTTHIAGIAKLSERVVSLLDIDAVMPPSHIPETDAAAGFADTRAA